MKVLIACEFSGIVREAFKKRGHDAWSCDLLPTELPGKHIQGDVRDILNRNWDLMIAHPPCTYLTVTGNKWFKLEFKDRFTSRVQDRREAVSFFMCLINAPIPRICVENPVGIMSRIYRPAHQIIQPFFFGHNEPKKTCLWLKNLPKLKYTKIVSPEYTVFKNKKRMPTWYCNASKLPKDERTKLRSRTFQGIADAMADQWGCLDYSTLLKHSVQLALGVV